MKETKETKSKKKAKETVKSVNAKNVEEAEEFAKKAEEIAIDVIAKEPEEDAGEKAGVLPQNFKLIGDTGAPKRIYILQETYRKIHEFTKDKKVNESGGILTGNIIEEFGKTNIIISGFIEAKHADATPTTLKFTHKTWELINKEMEKNHKGEKIVGWIHTHPNFGIFLSEYDSFIQSNFFKEDFHIAYVVDPIRKDEGFFCWDEGKTVKCEGFYVYDEPGEQIELASADLGEEYFDDDGDDEKKVSWWDSQVVYLIFLAVIVILFCVSIFMMRSQISKLESRVSYLEEFSSALLSSMQTAQAQLEDANGSALESEANGAALEGTAEAVPSETGEGTEPAEGAAEGDAASPEEVSAASAPTDAQ